MKSKGKKEKRKMSKPTDLRFCRIKPHLMKPHCRRGRVNNCQVNSHIKGKYQVRTGCYTCGRSLDVLTIEEHFLILNSL